MESNAKSPVLEVERLRRHPVQLEASVKRGGGELCSSIVRNFSLDGCCLSGYFRIGELLEIRIHPIGIFQAQIRWAMMGRAGARFAKAGTNKRSTLASNIAGVAAIEYAILLALIAVAIVASVAGLGAGSTQNWNKVNSVLADSSGLSYNSN